MRRVALTDAGARMDNEAIEVEALQKEIAKQLRSICTHIPPAEFDSYVERLAHVERSYKIADDLESLSRERPAMDKQP